MPRYALTIAYDGTDFCGWQKQEPTIEHAEGTGSMKHVEPSLVPGDPGRVALRTVQAVVEKAVREVVREPAVVFGASRTDSGVHARGQVAAFTVTDDPQRVERGEGWPESRGVDALLRAINGRLPDDVLATSARVVAAGFDPVADCVAKGYSYSILASRTRPLWDRAFVHQVWEPLDLDLMRFVAESLVGEHDFAAFAAAGHGRLSTVRKIVGCSVVEVDHAASAAVGIAATGEKDAGACSMPVGRRFRIEVSGNGFLWNMVRIIAGTIVEAGRGRITQRDVAEALASGDRRLAGPTLPACGLCLEWVRYG